MDANRDSATTRDRIDVGGADIVTLDFGTGITAAESPDTEINITLDGDQTVITSVTNSSLKIVLKKKKRMKRIILT